VHTSGFIPSRIADDASSGFSRFDAVDPTDGGQSQRHAASLHLQTHAAPGSDLSVTLFVVRSSLALFSDFSFYVDDPVHGDQVEQDDTRTTAGLRAAYRFERALGRWSFTTAVGAQARYDAVTNGQIHTQARRQHEINALSDVDVGTIGVFAEESISPASWVRLVIGARADVVDISVADRRPGLATPTRTRTGACSARSRARRPRWSSRHELARPVRERGLRFPLQRRVGHRPSHRSREPPRARDRVRGGRASAPRGPPPGECRRVGARPAERDGLERRRGHHGGPRADAAPRRHGRTALDDTPWLRADASTSLVHAEFTESPAGANAVPYAPGFVLSAGLSVRHRSGFFGSLRLRSVGDRPGDPQRQMEVQGFTLLDAVVGYRRRWWEVAVLAHNLLNATWREAQIELDSRLPSECLTTGLPRCNAPEPGRMYGAITDVAYTPGTPFSAQARVTFFLD